jgi:hypothetical protein
MSTDFKEAPNKTCKTNIMVTPSLKRKLEFGMHDSQRMKRLRSAEDFSFPFDHITNNHEAITPKKLAVEAPLLPSISSIIYGLAPPPAPPVPKYEVSREAAPIPPRIQNRIMREIYAMRQLLEINAQDVSLSLHLTNPLVESNTNANRASTIFSRTKLHSFKYHISA